MDGECEGPPSEEVLQLAADGAARLSEVSAALLRCSPQTLEVGRG